MKKTGLLLLGLLALGAVAGCGGPERTITKEEAEAWKNPPKTPPAEYHGNVMAPPGGPPAGKGGPPPGAPTGN